MPRIVELTPHNPAWIVEAQAEAARIARAFNLGPIIALAVHHIGSTAIPGILAKPTLDFLVEVRHLQAVEQVYPAMVALGYEPRGERGVPGRRYFARLQGERHTHHVHAFQHDHPEIARHLRFRDYLIAHPQDAQAYSELKQRLAQEFRTTPDQYTAAKASFIYEIDQKARRWRETGAS